MSDYFWTRNSKVIDDPKINVTFKEMLLMSDEDMTAWVKNLRKVVIEVWDSENTPPLNGKDKEGIIEQFKELTGYNVKTFQRVDDLDGKKNVILNPSSMGSCCNQFFPNMAKAKINYNTSIKDGDKFNGYAVYDLFKDERFEHRMQLGCRRHFKRDSFYKYSISIPVGSSDGLVPAKTGYDWCNHYAKNPTIFKDYGYWLCEVDTEPTKGSGYTETDASKFLTLNGSEIDELYDTEVINDINLRNVVFDGHKISKNKKFAIRMFKNDTRIFPNGFTAFKIGYIQVAVNFPPMIAKFLYEKYTEHCKRQSVVVVYDPSSGWGGRILGAMSLNSDRNLHYIGTDPNTDNFLPDLGKTRYEYLAEFFNSNTISEAQSAFGLKKVNSYDVYQLGSEDIGKNKRFQKYKGKIDFVFTSPPYFNREGYSEDETQSLKKFPQYESWREGFLRPTLTTCVEYLRPDRYLCWNIADIKVGDLYYPLEQDSRDILEELGMKFVGIEKMCLMNMPGANRVGEDGLPSCKNYCKVDGKWRKYEPIQVWWKPK